MWCTVFLCDFRIVKKTFISTVKFTLISQEIKILWCAVFLCDLGDCHKVFFK